MGTETGAGDGHDLGVMQEPVEPGHGQEGIAKKINPLSRGTVGSEQDAALLIAFGDDIVQVLRGGRDAFRGRFLMEWR